MRIDRVTMIVNFLGFKKVYSLILKSDGLYLIKTGNVGGLGGHVNTSANTVVHGVGGAIGSVAGNKILDNFRKELEENEKKLDSQSLAELLKEKGNSFVSKSEIQSVDVSYGKVPKMKLKSSKGTFKLEFTQTEESKIKELEENLKK